MVCEDVQNNDMLMMDNFTTYFFTAEYLLRFVTCWAVSPRIAGVLPASWEKLKKVKPNLEMPTYSAPYQMFKFVWQFKNLIDLASIFPSYVKYFTAQSAQSNFVRTLRLLRLVRILRLLRLMAFLKNVDVAMDLIWATLEQSSLMLSVFMFFVMVVVVLFGCLFYIAEQGEFTVNETYPNGECFSLGGLGHGFACFFVCLPPSRLPSSSRSACGVTVRLLLPDPFVSTSQMSPSLCLAGVAVPFVALWLQGCT
jgi:hypothetical protein